MPICRSEFIVCLMRIDKEHYILHQYEYKYNYQIVLMILHFKMNDQGWYAEK